MRFHGISVFAEQWVITAFIQKIHKEVQVRRQRWLRHHMGKILTFPLWHKLWDTGVINTPCRNMLNLV